MSIINTSAAAVHANVASRVYTGRSIDDAEARIAGLQKINERCRENYVMLQYDIPTAKATVCPNPSSTMWRHGFRMTLSCWVMPASQLDHPTITRLMAHWDAHGVKTHVIEYAESQRAKIEAIARQQLEEEIRRQHTALITNIMSADDRVKAAILASETAREQDRAECKRDNEVRAIIRKAGEQLNAAIACAAVFDETENVADLLAGLRNAIAAQRDAFNAEMAYKRSKPVTVALPPASVLAHKPEMPRMGRDAAPDMAIPATVTADGVECYDLDDGYELNAQDDDFAALLDG